LKCGECKPNPVPLVIQVGRDIKRTLITRHGKQYFMKIGIG